jgi:tripartite-type tricarboxylate transporter receptor subunit TctC
MLRYSVLVAAVGSLVAMPIALGQGDPAADYPNRPVKIIVSVPAGGGVDTVTRIFAAKLQQRLGQPFVIENRGGGGGNIGAEAAYVAEPDGYTLLATQPAPITSNIALYKKLNFDPVALEPVAVMSKFPNVLLVRPDFPAKTAQEFLAYAKANPGKVTYASQGNGSTSHLSAQMLATMAGIDMVHIPYKGEGPALIDLTAGRVDIFIGNISAALRFEKARQLKFLGVASRTRSPVAPDVPSAPEIGLPDLISSAWFALVVPPGTPEAIVEKINADTAAALK